MTITATAPVVPRVQGFPPHQPQPWGPSQPPAWAPRPPREVAPSVVVGVVLAAGLACAVFVPLDRPGLGWLLAGLAIAAGLAELIRRGLVRPPSGGGPADRVFRIGAAVAAVALLGVGAVRAAEWLFVLCVFGALLLAAVAAACGRTWIELAVAPLAAGIAIFPGAGWVSRGIAAMRVTRAGRSAGVGRVIAVAAATGLILLVFGGLLASADTVFAGVLDRMVPNVTVGSVFRGAFLLVAGVCVAAGLAWLTARPYRLDTLELPGRRRVSALDWGLPVGALNVLFAIFVWVQLGVLFGWHDYVLGPDGPDYAEYARSGFGQLILVTLLTFAVIAIVAHVACRTSERDRLLLRIQVGVLSVLSMVIVASAVNRLWLYQDAYGLTRLRLLGAVAVVWLGALFLLVIAAGIRLRGGWLARAVVGSAAATLLALAAANPDALIARWNVDRALQGKEVAFGRPVDRLAYLATLSADAVQAIERLPEPRRSCLLASLAADLDRGDPWYAVNLGRERAWAALARYDLRSVDCGVPSGG